MTSQLCVHALGIGPMLVMEPLQVTFYTDTNIAILYLQLAEASCRLPNTGYRTFLLYC